MLDLVPSISEEDAQREARIRRLLDSMNDECDTRLRVELWEKAKDEINSRSPAMVILMEIERGLR